MFELEVETPLGKSIPTGTRRLTQKRWRYSQKCVLQSCARNHEKINKKTFEHDISPHCRGAPAGPIAVIFCMLGGTHDVITRTKF